MYDDGLHNDGNANDQVYGLSFTMGSDYAQYYVYTENADAGLFMPARAEHEFYSLPGSAPVITGIAGIKADAYGQLKVYPNPATDVVYIQASSKTPEKVLVVTMLGETVYEAEAAEIHELNTNAWPAGTYLVKCGGQVSKLVLTK